MKQSKKKKLIFICDDIRSNSGVANQAREIILGTCQTFDWVHLAGSPNHPQAGKMFDISKDVETETGESEVSVKVLAVKDYGNADILRKVMEMENPDGILIFTDPRRWKWLFSIEREIRSQIPIMYYTIWDNYPVPMYNRPYYESVDGLYAISTLTKDVIEKVLGDTKKEKDITYVPHGINTRYFYKIDENHKEYQDLQKFKAETLGNTSYEFILFYNSQNQKRKNVPDIMRAYDKFCENLGTKRAKKCLLILHTNPNHPAGTDLYAVRDDVCKAEGTTIMFSPKKITTSQLNYMYNISNGVIQVSINEGWGLSVTEAMITGTPTIVGYTGGLRDQVSMVKKETGNRVIGRWSFVLQPSMQFCIGSQTTPYIYEDMFDVKDISMAIMNLYLLPKEKREELGEKAREYALENFTAKHLAENLTESINLTLKNFKPRKAYDFIKIQ